MAFFNCYGIGGGGGESDVLVSAGSSYDNYGNTVTDYDNLCTVFLHEGETIVFVINHRSALTLPQGVSLIVTSQDTAGTSNQRLTFAKYTAEQDEIKTFVFTVASAGRTSLDYAIFQNATITYTGDFYLRSSGAVHELNAPTKPSGAKLLWGMAAPTKTNNLVDGIQTTPADIYQISWGNSDNSNKVARGGAFYDDGSGAVNRTFGEYYATGNSDLIIDAVEIS